MCNTGHHNHLAACRVQVKTLCSTRVVESTFLNHVLLGRPGGWLEDEWDGGGGWRAGGEGGAGLGRDNLVSVTLL